MSDTKGSSPDRSPLLEVDHVSKSYLPPPPWLRMLVRTAVREPVAALIDVSLAVARGEVVGLVGPNGAGKTTLIRVIANLLEPDDGRVLVNGTEVTGSGLGLRGKLGLVLESDRGFYRRLDGRRNLEFFAVHGGLDGETAKTRAEELLQRFGLADRDKLVFGYSSGMKVRLSLARALIVDPPLLVLDEPTRSLDPVASLEVAKMMQSLAAEGRGILLSDHRLDELVSYCDRVAVIVGGRITYQGKPRDLEEGSGVPAATALRQMMTE